MPTLQPHRTARSRRTARGPRAAHALTRPNAHAEPINVTPLIDVVMVLIIFYLIVGHLVLERRGGVDLPTAAFGPREPRGDDPIILTIDRDGSIRLDAEPTPIIALAARARELLRATPGRSVQIRADRAAPFSSIRPALDALRAAGAQAVGLAAREAP